MSLLCIALVSLGVAARPMRSLQPRGAVGMSMRRLTDLHFEHAGSAEPKLQSAVRMGSSGFGSTVRALLPVAAGGALLLVGTPALAEMAAPVVAGVAEVIVKGPMDSAFVQSLSLIFVSAPTTPTCPTTPRGDNP
jgi:hypothetical protein